jgi:Flp pilus assembly protein TadD
MTTADRLKAEGNTLFQQRKYDHARDKYTAAIELDGENAILYANRAACELSLKKCVLFLCIFVTWAELL